MKPRSAASSFIAAASSLPASCAALYSGDSRMKVRNTSLSVPQPSRPLHALFAMPCNWLPCSVSACVAICCRRESIVVRTISPSE